MKKAKARPCRECPFLRTAAPGWLGNTDAVQFMVTTVDAEETMPCHMTVDYESEEPFETRIDKGHQCTGALIFLKNMCKLPREPERAAAVAAVSSDRETVFAHRQQFLDHHQTTPSNRKKK